MNIPQLCRGRVNKGKGVASIVGGVFIILIILSTYAFFVLMTQQNADFQSTLRDVSTTEITKNQEQLQIVSILPSTKGLIITVRNNSPVSTTLKYYAVNSSKLSHQFNYTDVSEESSSLILPGDANNYYFPVLNFNANYHYRIILVTLRGNVYTGDYPSMSYTPLIRLSPDSDNEGPSTVTVTGSYFTPNSVISLYWDVSTSLTTTPTIVRTDNKGSFSSLFSIPSPTSGGGHSVMATDSNYGSASATFMVAGTISLSGYSVPVGSSINIDGIGFSAGSIEILFDSTPQPSVTSTDGSFNSEITIPPAPAGPHTFTVTQGAKSDTSSIMVVPQITLNKQQGDANDLITINGSGFAANSNIILYFDHTSLPSIPSIVSSSDTGDFTCTFSVPSKPNGSYDLRVTDSVNTLDVSFKVN